MEIYGVSDLHTGDILFNHVEFQRFCDFIMEEPYRFVVINGDMLNNNLINSAGSPYEDVISPNDQKKEVKRMLKPIRERILCMNDGNHETRTKRSAGQNITEEIAEYLGVPYNEDENLLKISFGKRPNNSKRLVYTIYITHGNGGGKKQGNIVNNAEDLSKNIFADVYMVGHGHKRTGTKAVLRYPDLRNNKIIEVEQLFTSSAAWLNYGGYAVQKMYRPQVRGAHPVILRGDRKEANTLI